MEEMMLRSAAFNDHTIMPSEYSHDSGDVSPPLEWSQAPEEVVELYGLSEPSGLRPGFTAEDLRVAVQEKIVASGTLVGTFVR